MLPTGLPDTSFGTNGLVTLNFAAMSNGANAVAIQNDGQIVVGASVQLVNSNSWDEWEIIRLNSTNGSLDSTFGGGIGRVATNFSLTAGNFNNNKLADLAIQCQTLKIVACGQADPPNTGDVLALLRYTTAGDIAYDIWKWRDSNTLRIGHGWWKRVITDPVSGKIVGFYGNRPGAISNH